MSNILPLNQAGAPKQSSIVIHTWMINPLYTAKPKQWQDPLILFPHSPREAVAKWEGYLDEVAA